MRYTFYTTIALLILVLQLWSCGVKTIGITEMRSYYVDTHSCVTKEAIKEGISIAPVESTPKPVLTILPDATKVVIGDKEYLDYYTPDNVLLPENSNTNSIKHAFVHHFVYHNTDAGVDPTHKYAKWYLSCSGLQEE